MKRGDVNRVTRLLLLEIDDLSRRSVYFKKKSRAITESNTLQHIGLCTKPHRHREPLQSGVLTVIGLRHPNKLAV